MTIDTVINNGWLIFECISGSRSYGLDTPESDVDIKGVYILPKSHFYSIDYTGQVNNETNDIVYYELRRFVELLYKNNPTLLEMLNIGEKFILYKHPVFDLLKAEIFVSKLCIKTFAGYAITQIKKARGLKKKILNPIAKKRKTILNFCYVVYNNGSIPLIKWLDLKGFNHAYCGLVNVQHMKDIYHIYYDNENKYHYNGIIRKESATEVALSSIPKGNMPIGILYYNKDGFSTYCREYREYWDWVSKRNETRYKNTLESRKNYDAKNMMHTFRLLDMAIEILKTGKINVLRPNRDELLAIKSGQYEYDYLINRAEEKIKIIEDLTATCKLQNKPDKNTVNEILVKIRNDYYLTKENTANPNLHYL